MLRPAPLNSFSLPPRLYLQKQMLRNLAELLKTHLQARRVTEGALRRAVGICDFTFTELLESLELLRIAAEPEQPPAPVGVQPEGASPAQGRRRQQQQQQQQQGGPGQGAHPRPSAAAGGSPGGDSKNEYEEDSWLVGDDEEQDGSSCQGGASAGAEMPDVDGSVSGAEEQAEQPARRAWNTAGLQPGQTQVLVAPGLHEQQQQQQQQEQVAQPMASDVLPATEVVVGDAAGGDGDVNSAGDESDAAAQQQPSPPPSLAGAAAAMALAGDIMGGFTSDTEMALLPPSPVCRTLAQEAVAAVAEAEAEAAARLALLAAAGDGEAEGLEGMEVEDEGPGGSEETAEEAEELEYASAEEELAGEDGASQHAAEEEAMEDEVLDADAQGSAADDAGLVSGATAVWCWR